MYTVVDLVLSSVKDGSIKRISVKSDEMDFTNKVLTAILDANISGDHVLADYTIRQESY